MVLYCSALRPFCSRTVSAPPAAPRREQLRCRQAARERDDVGLLGQLEQLADGGAGHPLGALGVAMIPACAHGNGSWPGLPGGGVPPHLTSPRRGPIHRSQQGFPGLSKVEGSSDQVTRDTEAEFPSLPRRQDRRQLRYEVVDLRLRVVEVWGHADADPRPVVDEDVACLQRARDGEARRVRRSRRCPPPAPGRGRSPSATARVDPGPAGAPGHAARLRSRIRSTPTWPIDVEAGDRRIVRRDGRRAVHHPHRVARSTVVVDVERERVGQREPAGEAGRQRRSRSGRV